MSMANTDSIGVAHSPTTVPSSSSPSRPRQTRIRFPEDAEQPSLAGPLSLTGAGLRSLEPKSAHVQNISSATSLDDDFFERRRVRSTNASDVSHPPAVLSRAQFLATPGRSKVPTRRVVSYNPERSDKSFRNGTASIGSSPLSIGTTLPSEETDALAEQEDPNILADLRKALQYKSQVEKHLKDPKSVNFPTLSLPSTSSGTPTSISANHHISTAKSHSSEPSTPAQTEFVDFSPSVGKTSLHPIPTSTDDGATLDWSGSASEEDQKRERKWTMSLTRKASKEKHPTLSRKAIVEKQSYQYNEKLARIRAKADPSTMRKAEITRDQLQRRYGILEASFSSSTSSLNIAKIARWLSKQDSAVKSAITESEPMPWLRHLLQKREEGQKQKATPSPWNLSAMIVEEYVKANSDVGFTLPYSQYPSTADVVSDMGSSSMSPQLRRSNSRPTSFRSADHAPMRQKSDDLVSFEPLVYSRRDSIGTESRASVDTQLKRWRQSLAGKVPPDSPSPRSSVQSRPRQESVDLTNIQTGQGSPINTRNPLRALGIKGRPLSTPQHSDDGHSSAADSGNDIIRDAVKKNDKGGKKSGNEAKRSRFHLSLDLRSAQVSSESVKQLKAPISFTELRTDISKQQKSRTTRIAREAEASGSTDAFDAFSPNKLASPIVLSSVRKTEQRKLQRLTLPPAFQNPRTRRGRHEKKSEAQEHALHVEYTRKKEMLESLAIRNSRMKQLLQVASKIAVDFDETQSLMSKRYKLGRNRIPEEVLEAFSHDPSAITGHTRNVKGWRAVEDIHERRLRQIEVFTAFADSIPSLAGALTIPENGIYEEPLEKLHILLEGLQNQRETVLTHVIQTHDLLRKVKGLRDKLKPEFEETSRHTAANYPELVRLEVLLDEFVSQTDRLWQLSEAFLSFILTSLAPLMKTFGRPIWNELHDFLVIPLYRNDFSGEDEWYPVTFPHRSFSQWLRLLTIASSIPLCLRSGIYAFFCLLTEGYLVRVPAYIPHILVYLIISSFMCAFAFLLFVLLGSMLCELFIIFWWLGWILRIVR